MHACLICKLPQRHALCAHCLAGLFRLREPFRRTEDGFRVRSLFSWYNSSERALPWLVRSLKGQDRATLWRPIATMMLHVLGPLPAPTLIPIPSKHALGLARALAELTGATVCEPLVSTRPSGQKLLDRWLRQEIGFVLRDCMKYRNVVICDDIVTTGATARAAFRALGSPPHSEVWCLADRRPCGD